jgi:hypothetical protein
MSPEIKSMFIATVNFKGRTTHNTLPPREPVSCGGMHPRTRSRGHVLRCRPVCSNMKGTWQSRKADGNLQLRDVDCSTGSPSDGHHEHIQPHGLMVNGAWERFNL